MINIYKEYNFIFEKDRSIELFREILKEKGLDSKQKFTDYVLKFYPYKSKSTLEEYYMRRLCNDTDVLMLLHKEIGISLQDIFLPNSVCKNDKHIIKITDISYSNEVKILDSINRVLYNSNNLNDKSSSEDIDEYFESLDTLLDVYAYLNFLIQKVTYSYLSTYEREVLVFLTRFLTYGKIDSIKYLENNKSEKDILSKFYANNTLCLFEGKKHYLLEFYKVWNLFDGEKLLKMLSIIPLKERNILYNIYKRTNNDKISNALLSLGAHCNNNLLLKDNIKDSEIESIINDLADKEIL